MFPELHSAVWSRLSKAGPPGSIQGEDPRQDDRPRPYGKGHRRQDPQLLFPLMWEGAAARYYGSGMEYIAVLNK